MDADPVFLHLRVNHFPIILAMVGAGAAVVAAILRRDAIWRYALVTVLLGALSAPAAYWTGNAAEEKAEGFSYIDADAMGEHEESAEIATIVCLAAGVAAAVALAKPNAATRWIFLALALGAAGTVAWTGMHAGRIVHGSDLLE
jgi:hypothetical protein